MNNFLKEKKEFHSVNIMIQMEYCSGKSLEKYLQLRNSKIAGTEQSLDRSLNL